MDVHTHRTHRGRTPTAAAARSFVAFKNQPQLSAMRRMLDSIVLQNEDLFLGPISPSAGLRKLETARNAVPVHACDWIASQRYWISSGFPVGVVVIEVASVLAERDKKLGKKGD